ncbi:hypothetical protein AAG906_009474 [Vitis piasezkii]
MSKLPILRLGQNNLTWVIPFTLGNLSSLQTLMGILTNSLSANALPNKLRFSNLNFFNRSIAQSSGSGSLGWIQCCLFGQNKHCDTSGELLHCPINTTNLLFFTFNAPDLQKESEDAGNAFSGFLEAIPILDK